MRENYIEYCEDIASMAMQPKAWMMAILFSHWISHFIKVLESRGGISPNHCRLLVVDGHNNHVILDVVHKAMQIGLDIVILPSHTSHRLQPLDVSIFGPLKRASKRYRDAWSLRNKGRGATKQILAQWVSSALQKALTIPNIQTWFKSTGIWPLNSHAIDKYLALATQFVPLARENNVGSNPSSAKSKNDSKGHDNDSDHVLEEIQGTRIGDFQPMRQNFYAGDVIQPTSLESNESDHDLSMAGGSQSRDVVASDVGTEHSFAFLLQLPEVRIHLRHRHSQEDHW